MKFLSVSRIFSTMACLMSVLLALNLFQIMAYFFDDTDNSPLSSLLAAPAHAVAAPQSSSGGRIPDPPASLTPQSSGAAPVPPAPEDPRRVALLGELGARQKQLDDMDRALAERQRIVAASEVAMQEKMAAYAKIIDDYKARDQASHDMSDADLLRLVRIYENMSPRDAAAIFNVLDMHVMVRVIDHMNPRKASAIMAGMLPERVSLTTQMLVSLHPDAAKVASLAPAH